MPGYLLSVPDIGKSVLRPVVLQVCGELRAHLHLGRDCELSYAGDTLAIPQSGSFLSERNDLPNVGKGEKLYVDFKEVPRRESNTP